MKLTTPQVTSDLLAIFIEIHHEVTQSRFSDVSVMPS